MSDISPSPAMPTKAEIQQALTKAESEVAALRRDLRHGDVTAVENDVTAIFTVVKTEIWKVAGAVFTVLGATGVIGNGHNTTSIATIASGAFVVLGHELSSWLKLTGKKP